MNGQIPFDAFPSSAQQQLKMLDTNGDGALDTDEILAGLATLKREQYKSKMYRNFLIALGVLSLIMLASVFGLTYSVIQITKESEVKAGGVLTVRGTSEPVRVASTEFDVRNGTLTSRTMLNTSCSNGTCPASPIMTAQSTSLAKLTSLLDDEQLAELKSMKIVQGQSFLHLQIFALARYEEVWSRYGSVVVIYTHLGEITLDGEAIFFHEKLEGAFARAGFKVDTRGRRLLGVVEILGMFNLIKKAISPREKTEHDLPNELPASPPMQYMAHVVEVEFCEDETGMSTYSCETGSGKTVNWVTKEDSNRNGLRLEEEQYSLLYNGRHWAKTIQSKAQWPEQQLVKIQNETHRLKYQTFRGKPYFCELSEDQSLKKVVSNRRALVDPSTASDFKVVFHGFQSVNEVYCKHFEIQANQDGKSETFQVYEDYYKKRLYEFVRGNLRWRFEDLKPIETEEYNPIPFDELDMEVALKACDSNDLTPPVKLVEGSVSDIMVPNPSWGQANNKNSTIISNETSSFLIDSNSSRRLLYDKGYGGDEREEAWEILTHDQLRSKVAEGDLLSQSDNASLRSVCTSLGISGQIKGPYKSVSDAKKAPRKRVTPGSIGPELAFEACLDNIALYMKAEIGFGCPSFAGDIDLEIRGLNSRRPYMVASGSILVSVNICRCPPMRLPSAIAKYCAVLSAGLSVRSAVSKKEYFTCLVGGFSSNPLITGWSSLHVGPYFASAELILSGSAYLGFKCGSRHEDRSSL